MLYASLPRSYRKSPEIVLARNRCPQNHLRSPDGTIPSGLHALQGEKLLRCSLWDPGAALDGVGDLPGEGQALIGNSIIRTILAYGSSLQNSCNQFGDNFSSKTNEGKGLRWVGLAVRFYLTAPDRLERRLNFLTTAFMHQRVIHLPPYGQARNQT